MASTLADMNLADFDFLDLGCGHGASTRQAYERWNGRRGLGVDFAPRKIAAAREAGFEVVQGDATDLGVRDAVRFSLMMDFLEHLPTLDHVERAIANAAQASTDFLVIFHPSFEGKEYLTSLGLCQYWWRWSGHKTHIRVSDYCLAFDRLGLNQYLIRYLMPITDSHHPTILTTAEPIDQFRYDPAIHRIRPHVRFVEPVWRAQEIFVALRSFGPEEWGRITAPIQRPSLY